MWSKALWDALTRGVGKIYGPNSFSEAGFPSSVQLNDCLNYICNFPRGSLTFQVCKPPHQQFSVNGRPSLLRAIERPCILKVIKRMATHASASHNTEVPHLVIKKVHSAELYGCQILITESCFIHLAQFPRCFITWRQENCWNWWLKPIYVKGARLWAIGSIWGTSNLQQATRQCLRMAAISLGRK